MNVSNELADLAIVHSARALVADIAKALVDNQEAVRVNVTPDGEGAILCLQVATEDLGKVIGKQGRTARSIRTIIAAFGMKTHKRLSLDIQIASTLVPLV